MTIMIKSEQEHILKARVSFNFKTVIATTTFKRAGPYFALG